MEDCIPAARPLMKYSTSVRVLQTVRTWGRQSSAGVRGATGKAALLQVHDSLKSGTRHDRLKQLPVLVICPPQPLGPNAASCSKRPQPELGSKHSAAVELLLKNAAAKWATVEATELCSEVRFCRPGRRLLNCLQKMHRSSGLFSDGESKLSDVGPWH